MDLTSMKSALINRATVMLIESAVERRVEEEEMLKLIPKKEKPMKESNKRKVKRRRRKILTSEQKKFIASQKAKEKRRIKREEDRKMYAYYGIKPEFWERFKEYKMKVWSITNKQDVSVLEGSEERGWRRYHLDHKYSIMQGFRDNIPPHYIGNIGNLRFIYWEDNYNKGVNCSITKDELFSSYIGHSTLEG